MGRKNGNNPLPTVEDLRAVADAVSALHITVDPAPEPAAAPAESRLRAALAQERTRRERACLEELTTLLQRHDCQLVAEPQLVPTGGGAFAVASRVFVAAR
jgi:hypothetical protein